MRRELSSQPLLHSQDGAEPPAFGTHVCTACSSWQPEDPRKQAQRQGWSGSGLRHSYLVDQKEEPGGSLLSWLDGGRPMPLSQVLFCCRI